MAERILVVDDHPLTRDALTSLLAQGGFDVVGEAGDGAEALEQAHTLQPDLILLDLSMPGMDGLTVLPRLRSAAPPRARPPSPARSPAGCSTRCASVAATAAACPTASRRCSPPARSRCCCS